MKQHKWTEPEVEQLCLTMEAMRDLHGVLCDLVDTLHQRISILEMCQHVHHESPTP